MIYRHEIERACLAFTETSGVTVTANALDVISALLNAPVAASDPRWREFHPETERRIRAFLREDFASMMQEVADEAQRRHSWPRLAVTGTDILHFVVREWRPMPHRLGFIFDKN